MMQKQERPPNTVFKIITFILLSGITGAGCLLILLSGILKPLSGFSENLRKRISLYQLTLTPTPIPTSTLIWIWQRMPPFDWNVDLPSGWYYNVINRRPDPGYPGTNQKIFGHDCANYELINQNETQYIFITMPCEGGEGWDYLCPDDTVVVENLENGKFLIRKPSQNYNGYDYEVSTRGNVNGWIPGEPEIGFSCLSQDLRGLVRPIYTFFEPGKKLNEYIFGPIVDRIMYSLVTSNPNSPNIIP